MKQPFVHPVICVLLAIACQCTSTGSGRTSVEIIVSTTPVDEYQVDLRLTVSNFDFAIVRPDGSNIRFYDKEGNKLPYWIQQWNPKTVSVIWVRVKNAGTESIVIKPDAQDVSSESSGESVFDKVGWDTFRKDWLFSGIESGRVAGWEDPLTDYRLDTAKWKTCDIAGKYVGVTDYSRWFVRKEFFLGKGQIGFSGNTNNAGVWTIIGSDEIYRKIAGDERDTEGKAKGKYSHSFVIEEDFGRYVWAGRGQIRTGTGDLSILSVDSGLGNIYARKHATGAAVVKKNTQGVQYADSIFPGNPKSLPEKSITRGWRAWPGAENMYIAKEGGAPLLVSPILAEKQKFLIPTRGFADSFELTMKVAFQTPRSFDTLLDIAMGPLAFGISHERGDGSYRAYVNDSWNFMPVIKQNEPVSITLKKEKDFVTLSVDGERKTQTTLKDNAGFLKSSVITVSAMNPKIYDFSVGLPQGKNTMLTHTDFFREDFSGMREGAVFYGWKGIEEFKIVNEAGRIALVSLTDDSEQGLDISELPFPDDFRLGVDIGLPLSRETQFSMRVWTGTVNFGIRANKGKFYFSFKSEEKEVTSAKPGERVAITFYKQGSLFGLSVGEEKVYKDLEISDFVIGRTITIKSVNPRFYEVYIEDFGAGEAASKAQ